MVFTQRIVCVVYRSLARGMGKEGDGPSPRQHDLAAADIVV